MIVHHITDMSSRPKLSVDSALLARQRKVLPARLHSAVSIRLHRVLLLLAVSAVAATGCRRSQGEVAGVKADDVIIMIGDSALTDHDVLSQIPSHLSGEDSAAFYESVVREWVDDMLLKEIAAENVTDMQRIEHMVSQYRNHLILTEYRRNRREYRRSDISNDTLREYYTRHAGSLVLDRPQVKGLFLKIPADAHRISDIRRWMTTATPEAIDNLEKYGLAEAVKYSFFEDRWMDFGTIAEQIPYRFFDPDAFVEASPYFETTYRGMTYMLHISDFIRSGNTMPFETAVPLMRERILAESGRIDDKKFMISLYNRAIKSGKMKVIDKDNLKILQK